MQNDPGAAVFHENPPRKCGRKKAGGFYLGASMGGGGALHSFSWILGDGLEGGENAAFNIPPRIALRGNLAASLSTGEYVPADVPVSSGMIDESLLASVGSDALFDHVGSKSYSPSEFHNEVVDYGPSRRVDEATAAMMAKNLPVPIVFTHSRVPIFTDTDQRDRAIGYCRELLELSDAEKSEMKTSPTWRQEGWGITGRSSNGSDHYMRHVLNLVARIDGGKVSGAGWEEAKQFFGGVNFTEQAFGVSWINRVDYVAKPGDDPGGKGAKLRQNIGVIDLEKPDGDV